MYNIVELQHFVFSMCFCLRWLLTNFNICSLAFHRELIWCCSKMSSRLTKILFFAQCLPFYVLLYFSDCGWSVVSVPWCCCGCNIYRVTGKILLVVKPVCVFEVSIQRQSFYVVSLFFYMNYMIFIYLQSFIHLFTGLFGTNLTTSNHLAS